MSHMDIGNLLAQAGKPAEALKAYQTAQGVQQKLADDNPTVTAFQEDLARSKYNFGLSLARMGKSSEALEVNRGALVLRWPRPWDTVLVEFTSIRNILPNSVEVL